MVSTTTPRPLDRLRLRARTKLAALVVAGLGSACNGSGAGPGGDGGGGGGDGGGGCQPPGVTTDRGALQVSRVEASVIDATGQPAVGLPALVVGLDLASPPSKTDADGRVTIAFAHSLQAPVFRFGDGVKWPLLEIPLLTGMVGYASLPTAALPSAGAALGAGKSSTSGELTLTIAAGAQIGIDTLTYASPDEQLLRAVALPNSAKLYLDPHNLGLELLVGVAPAETTLCPPASLSLGNGPGWPAGTPVELFRLGGDVGQQAGPFGDWLKLGEGTVSSDGKRLTFGAIIQALGTLGVRKKP